MLRFSCGVSRDDVSCFLILGLLCCKQTQIMCIKLFGAHDEENISFRFVCSVIGYRRDGIGANYYPPSDIVETTDPAAAQAVLKQAREIQMQESTSSQPVKQKANKTRKGKKKTVRKTKTVTEETSMQ